MISFRHIELSRTLTWDDNHRINELVIENQSFMRRVCSALSGSDDESLSISVNDKPATIGKEADTIFNPVNLDFNNRRAIATLLKMLAKTSVSEEFYLSTNAFKTKVVDYLNKLIDSESFVFGVEADEFSLDAIAKAVNLHIVSDDDDYIELLTDYMSMMVELAGVKIFVFINLRQFITNDELIRLVHNINNHDIDVMLVEGKDAGKIDDVSRIVIDADLDEI